MAVSTRIGILVVWIIWTAPFSHAVAQDAGETGKPAEAEHAAFDVRLVQLDLRRAAAIQDQGGGGGGISETWGVTFGLTFDGELRFKPPVFFLGDDGELRIGQQVWQLGAALDDAERGIARPGSPFTVLSAPRIRCRQGEEAVISMGTPVDYLLLDAHGCLRPAQPGRDPIDAEGVDIRLRPALIDDEAVEFDPVDVSFRRVVSREPIEGVPFDVGRPVMHEDRLRRAFRLVGDDVAVMLLSRPDANEDGPIFVVISRADDPKEQQP